MAAPSEIYSELESALRERLTIIADREHYQRDPAGHLARLQACSDRLARLRTQMPGDADRQLAHFLERCSFDKALAFLGKRHPSLRAFSVDGAV